jgi:hypothetical protein
MLAAQGWCAGWEALRARWQASRAGKIAVLMAFLAVFLLFVTWGWEITRDFDQLVRLFGPFGNHTFFPY